MGDPTNGNFFIDVGKATTLITGIKKLGLDPTPESAQGQNVLDQQMKFPGPLPKAGEVQDIVLPLALRCITGELSVEQFQTELRDELASGDYIDP